MILTTDELRLLALALRRLSGDAWGIVHYMEGVEGDHSALYEDLSNHIAAIDTLLARLGSESMTRP